MNHECTQPCLYCVVEFLYQRIEELKEKNHKLSYQCLSLKSDLRREKEKHKEINMIDPLMKIVQNHGFIAIVLNHLLSLEQNVLSKLESEVRNAAIDSIVNLLQEYKVPVSTTQDAAAPE